MKVIGICMGLQASTIAGAAVARRAVITMVKIFILIRVGRDGGFFFWIFMYGKGRVVLRVCSKSCLKLDTADERGFL